MKLIFILFLVADPLCSACVSVNGERILAGDFARALPLFGSVEPDRLIGFAPLPGTTRNYSVREVLLLARRLGIRFDNSEARSVCFEREAHSLTEGQIRDALIGAVEVPGATIEIVDYTHAALPPGRIEFPRNGVNLPPPSSPEGPVLWRGRLICEGGRSFPIWVKAKVLVESSVVIATTALVRGKEIQPDQVALATQKRSVFLVKALNSPEQAAGRIPKQNIPPGHTIANTAIEEPKDIAQGDTIRVEALSGAARIQFEAKAQSGGRRGDSILVQNPSNGHSFRALIVDRGVVRIRAAGPAVGNATHSLD